MQNTQKPTKTSQNDKNEPQTGTNNNVDNVDEDRMELSFLSIQSYCSFLKSGGNGVDIKILKGRCTIINEGVKFQKDKSSGVLFAEKTYRFILNTFFVQTLPRDVQENLRGSKYVVYCSIVFLVDLATGERKSCYLAGEGLSFWSSEDDSTVAKRCFGDSCEVQENGSIHVIGYPLPREELRRRVPNGCYFQFVMQIRHRDHPGDILCEFFLNMKKNVQKSTQTYAEFVEKKKKDESLFLLNSSPFIR